MSAAPIASERLLLRLPTRADVPALVRLLNDEVVVRHLSKVPFPYSEQDATDFIGWYMDTSMRRLGIAKTDAAAQYLAYHEGRAGYQRGSHNSKPWLITRSREVASRAARYERQLEGCRI